MKIAVYSCLFGNYRKDLLVFNSIDSLDPQIDYYFFTDNLSLKSNKWKIIYTPLLYSNEQVIERARLTSKYVKFTSHNILEEYDILVWIDCKHLSNKVIYKNILNLFEKYPAYDIFNLQHPVRTLVQDELKCTMRIKVENKEHGTNFLEKIKDFVSPFILPETCIIIRKNTASNKDVFHHCYNLLRDHNLRRDQNIYNYSFYEKNIIPLILPTIPILLNNV